MTSIKGRAVEAKRPSETMLVFLFYALLTVALTYPAVFFLRTKVLGGPADNFHFLWELWYVAHALFAKFLSRRPKPAKRSPHGDAECRCRERQPRRHDGLVVDGHRAGGPSFRRLRRR